MMCNAFLIFSVLMIVNITYSVKYEGIIKLVDTYGYPFGPLTPFGYFPEHRIQYYDMKSPKYHVMGYYNVTDPLTGISTPMAVIELCKIHEVDSLTPLYNLTTIIATYALPMGYSCKTATGSAMMAQSLRSTYYLPREPTTCDHFNITAEFTDITQSAVPYLTMIFTVTKPGGPCDKSSVTSSVTTLKTPENPSGTVNGEVQVNL